MKQAMAKTNQAGGLGGIPKYTDTGFDMRNIALAAALKLSDSIKDNR